MTDRESIAIQIRAAMAEDRARAAAEPRCYCCDRPAEVMRHDIPLCAECAEPIPVPA